MPNRPEPVPDLDWSPERARQLGEDVVDLWTELLGRLPELPVSGEFRADRLRERLALELPEEPLERGELLEHLRALVFEGSIYPGHPGFMAYISGAGTVPGAAADLIAAGLNQNVGAFRLSPGATTIEEHLTGWLADRFGLPEGAGGQLVAGGALANLVGTQGGARPGAGRGRARARGGRGPGAGALRLHGVARGPGARGRPARPRDGRSPARRCGRAASACGSTRWPTRWRPTSRPA